MYARFTDQATRRLPAPRGPVYTLNMHNRFFLWLYSYATPVQLDLGNLPPDLPATDLRYFVRILQHLDQLLPGAGMTFVLTWHLDAFHEVMKDAVVLLMGDEMHQTPSYQRRVKAIFKTCGLRRDPVGTTSQLPLSIAWRVFLREARNGVIQVKRWWQREPPRKIVTPRYEIPLGYCMLRDVDPLPIEQRPLDAFFAGSAAITGHWGTLRAPAIARKQMTAALAAVQTKLPQCRIKSVMVTPVPGTALTPESYTQDLASAKIALSPRGNHDAETARLFEAAKVGCAIISEPLPPRWYLQGCPAVIIRKWPELPDVLSDLLNDSARLKELSVQGRQWWDSTNCEVAVANYIAQQLTNSGRLRRQEQNLKRCP